jgi:hypothetical protein
MGSGWGDLQFRFEMAKERDFPLQRVIGVRTGIKTERKSLHLNFLLQVLELCLQNMQAA